MAWAGKALKDHPVPRPCHGQGDLPLDQVAPGPIPEFGMSLRAWQPQELMQSSCATFLPDLPSTEPPPTCSPSTWKRADKNTGGLVS